MRERAGDTSKTERDERGVDAVGVYRLGPGHLHEGHFGGAVLVRDHVAIC